MRLSLTTTGKIFKIFIQINTEILYGKWSKRKNADGKSGGKADSNYRSTD